MVKQIFILMLFAGLCACTSLETDKISDKLDYKPNVSVPLGYMDLKYDSPVDLPVDLPDPIESEPISWIEQDTIIFDIGASSADRKYIISMLMQFDITNRYPAELDVEMYFIDESGNDVYITESPIRIEAAEIDASGKVIKEKKSIPYPYQIPLSDEQIDLLNESDQFIIKGSVKNLLITTEVYDNFDQYNMYTAIGAQAQIKITVNDK
ncbi:MAG: hypothetical protein N4A74_16380 [Carboxylicivirga sp.]|jgi:hypothetical protein|nr:hypothetical protein [Carboxylicivirga sp.]